MSPQAVVVVGSANLDLVLSVDRRPAGGETVLGSDLHTSGGGKGANQAVAAGRLGGRVIFAGCVGDDSAGRTLRGSLDAAGVSTEFLREVSAPTGTAVILLTPDGENSIVVAPGANQHVTTDLVDLLEAVWPEAAVLVVQLEIPLATVEHAVARAAAAGVRVVVNAAPAAALSPQCLRRADPLVVNESEAAFLLGEPIGEEAGDLAVRLLGAGAASVVVTLGARGALIAQRGDVVDNPDRATTVHVPAEPVRPVDTTGAGDAFVGALAVCLAEGHDLPAAVRRASLVAAHAVTGLGAQDSFPTREQAWRPTAHQP